MASSSSSNQNAGRVLKRASPSTIHDKFLVGYQGWFTCAGDGEPVGPGHHGWLHWFNYPIPDGGHPNIDLWPDVSAYSPSELFPAPGLKTKDDDPVFLFSSRNAKTVQRHFHWMAEHGVDGAFLQRFVGQCDIENGQEGIRRIRDEVGDRVREAAEREGRVFAIMYDVAGVAPERLKGIIEQDWVHLVRNKGVLDSPNYLKEKGKPVVAIWGFGFDNAKHTPELVHSITQFFRDNTPGGVYIMGGTPTSWRTAEGDADRDSRFLDVWMSDFDAISPWTVGRYTNEQEADQFMETKMKGDVELIKQHNEKDTGRKIDYIPVVLPGGSGFNMSEGNWGFNNIKRRGGRFLWKQIANAKRLGVRTMYGAMWDEYDEGTALMPVVELKRNLPVSDKFRFMALDEDGYDCPADWFMRICGFAAEGLRSERRIHETFPVKELQDYWSSRPKYEEVSQKSREFISGSVAGGADGSGSGSGASEGQTYEEWLLSQKDDKDEAPPPAYTLIEDEPSVTPAAASQPQAHAQVQAAAPAPAVVAAPVVINAPPSNNVPQVSRPISQETAPPVVSVQPPVQNTVAPGPANQLQAVVNVPPQQYPNRSTPADPVASLTHDFGRQSISEQTTTVINNTPAGGSYYHAVGPPPPPPHSTRPDADNSAAPVPTNRPPRPQSLSRPHSRPQSLSRPSVPHSSPPHSPHAYQSSYAPPPPVVPASLTAQQASAPPQWPPAEWGVNPGRTSSASVPPKTPTSPTNTHSGYGPAAQSTGGANLSRPNTFTASSYVGVHSSLRPTASLHNRPSQQPPVGANASYYSASSTGAQRPTSPYAPPTVHSSNTYNNSNDSTFPQPGRYNVAPEPSIPGPGRDYETPYFPNPSTTGYVPAISNYPSQGSAYPSPGPTGSYQPTGYGSWGSSPNVSPQPNPLGPSSFPGQTARPYNPAQGPYYTGPSFPSNANASSMPNASSEAPGQERPYHFPQAPGADSPGEGSYYGSSPSATGGGDMNMPGANLGGASSPTFPSSYASQYGMPASGAYPSGGVGQSYLRPDPWVPGGGVVGGGPGSLNMPPGIPPRWFRRYY
ncbi:hypothetical protein BDN70DRAFT_435959 [Pholiota conissans]|uniref:Xylosidase/arabinosidase n=1 Tax=Pholiota conissans TaxID=109636 RepID=A0A9P5Z8V7_9AGAR|nr:hypothetical protein BDN70DRAFT_435959 [Pholiota conissans]